MKNLLLMLSILLASATLGGCDDHDVRTRTYLEVACPGLLVEEKGKYSCVRTSTDTVPIDISTLTYRRTVTVNRRTGSVAFNGQLIGECHVADFDAWECVDRTERSPKATYDIVWYRWGRSEGGYIEDWCDVKPGAPAAHATENCDGQRYYGISIGEFANLRLSLRDEFCSTNAYAFCKLF
jgi:hypothetical protein